MRRLPQQEHCDIGLVDDDFTEDLRPSEAAPVTPGVTSTGRGPLRTIHPSPQRKESSL
jgi:hypothetical protein